jgi:hypothetical protein
VIFFLSQRPLVPLIQGCQMVSLQTKNPNLGIFWRTLEWKIVVVKSSVAVIKLLPVSVCRKAQIQRDQFL